MEWNNLSKFYGTAVHMASDALFNISSTNISPFCSEKKKLQTFIIDALSQKFISEKEKYLKKIAKQICPIIKALIVLQPLTKISTRSYWIILFFAGCDKLTNKDTMQRIKMRAHSNIKSDVSPIVIDESNICNKFGPITPFVNIPLMWHWIDWNGLSKV